MPQYSFLVRNSKGESYSGTREAKDKHELAKLFHEEGFVLIKADVVGQNKRKKKFFVSIPFFNRVPLKEKLMFVRNLRVMILAGVSLPRALEVLSNQSKNKRFKKVLLKIKEEIIKGKSFSDSLEIFPDIFSELFCSMIRIGEESGTMADVLKVLSDQIKKEHELKSKIKGAMIYPAVIIFVMIVVGIVMLIMVVPKLANVFNELNITLPFTTRILIFIGNFLAKYWYFLPIGFLVLIFIFRIISQTNSGKLFFDTLVLKIPIINSIIKKNYSANTTRTLSSLIGAGVSVVRSLEIVSNYLNNLHYKKIIIEAAEQVKKGSKLADAFKNREAYYPALVFQMLEVGEETGETVEVLKKLADFYEEEVTEATKNLSTLIEPFLMIIVGAVVGFFAISMIQPIYSIMGTI